MKLFAKTVTSVAIVTTAALGTFPKSAEAIMFNSGQNVTDLRALKLDSMSKLMFDLAPIRGANFDPGNTSPLLQMSNNSVVIDAVAADDVNLLLSDLQGLGLQSASTFGSFVSGMLPIEALSSMATLESLKFAMPAYALNNVGLTTSQADVAMRADVARSQFGVDGTGVTVGVLSDSFNYLGGAAEDVASGDLPSGINVLKDLPSDGSVGDGIDEGRGMMQLIHDVAPGADLAFHTAFLGQADFANGIIDLANAGSDVIVDDVVYLNEPMFQDGIIAQAVDTVVDQGVPYFSSAGNADRNAYESAFNPSGLFEPLFGGELHDFNLGAGVDVLQSITIPVNTPFLVSFQWDSPFFSVSGGVGSPNDLDIFLFDESGTNLLTGSFASNIGNDAVEILDFFNDGSFGTDQFNLAISNFAGLDPSLMKYISFAAGTINEYDTASGTVFGHANAAGAEAVGAAFYQETPEFGQNPPLLEPFSAAGPTPILFDTAGNRLENPDIRMKPEIVAPDGTNTTFFPPFPGSDVEGDGFPNFFGTSAAAPHAAAVAALMLDAAPGTSPAEIYDILEKTAIDMNEPGFDFDSGFGLIQADRAVAAVVVVPEPNSVLSLLALGAVGAGSRLLRKQQRKTRNFK